MTISFHHVALSVRDIEKSQNFYEKLGFVEVHRWTADDDSLAIVQLKIDIVILELFGYSQNRTVEPRLVNKQEVGVKHMGLIVSDIQAKYAEMQQAGYEIESTEVLKARTGVDYFFIKDPDGMRVEIVQDDRGY